MPRLLRPASSGMGLVVQGSLPPRIRQMYGFSWTPAHAAAFSAATAASRLAHVRTPEPAPKPFEPVLKGRAAGLFGWIRRTERRHAKAGKSSMPGWAEEYPNRPKGGERGKRPKGA
jgi:hypothetical protein